MVISHKSYYHNYRHCLSSSKSWPLLKEEPRRAIKKFIRSTFLPCDRKLRLPPSPQTANHESSRKVGDKNYNHEINKQKFKIKTYPKQGNTLLEFDTIAQENNVLDLNFIISVIPET